VASPPGAKGTQSESEMRCVSPNIQYFLYFNVNSARYVHDFRVIGFRLAFRLAIYMTSKLSFDFFLAGLRPRGPRAAPGLAARGSDEVIKLTFSEHIQASDGTVTITPPGPQPPERRSRRERRVSCTAYHVRWELHVIRCAVADTHGAYRS